jgi:hypothetical protein
MTSCTKRLAVILVLIAIAGCGGGGGSSVVIPANNVPASLEHTARLLAQNLQTGGFETARGYFYAFHVADCQYPIAILGNCAANNPVAPYIFYAIPSWPDEYVDTRLTNLFGPTPVGYNTVFRFDPREAIIILAQLPPPAAYFGLQTYEFTREGTINTQDPIYALLGGFSVQLQKLFFDYAPDTTRIRIMASMGNATNNVVVADQSGASFGQQRYFITTPDQYMARTMTQYLLNAGAPNKNQIFAEPVSSIFKVGLGKSAYDFFFVMRFALPASATDGDVWRANLPMVVLRVRDKDPYRMPELYPAPVLDVRAVNDEAPFALDLNKLAIALKNRWAQPGATSLKMFDTQSTLDLVGPDCELIHNMNCQADTQDTTYVSSVSVSLDNQEVYAVLGTMGTRTGSATYVNVSLYEAALLYGVQSIDNKQIEGSATQFCADADCTGVNNVDKFYLFYVTRDCQILGLSNCFSIGTDKIGTDRQLKIVQRTYIKPGTQRGPDSTKLLLPQTYQLDGRKIK